MSDDKRTRADLIAALEVALERAERLDKAAISERARADIAVKQAAADLAALDPEARAIAACVQAIDNMTSGRATSYSSGTYYSGNRFDPMTGERIEYPRPPLGSSPVGRIILHLAARYEVDLGVAS